MKRIVLEPENVRSDAWKVVDALSDNIRWHLIHLEFRNSGKTGKFYRIFMPDQDGVDAICQWGARPSLSDPFYGHRGQYKAVSQAQARELLRQKTDKGYHIVMEGSAPAPKTATRQRLVDVFFPQKQNAEKVSFTTSSAPLWHGWRY